MCVCLYLSGCLLDLCVSVLESGFVSMFLCVCVCVSMFVTIICFGLTTDCAEAERVELIAII